MNTLNYLITVRTSVEFLAQETERINSASKGDILYKVSLLSSSLPIQIFLLENSIQFHTLIDEDYIQYIKA